MYHYDFNLLFAISLSQRALPFVLVVVSAASAADVVEKMTHNEYFCWRFFLSRCHDAVVPLLQKMLMV